MAKSSKGNFRELARQVVKTVFISALNKRESDNSMPNELAALEKNICVL
jgi:hypothetical protein